MNLHPVQELEIKKAYQSMGERPTKLLSKRTSSLLDSLVFGMAIDFGDSVYVSVGLQSYTTGPAALRRA